MTLEIQYSQDIQAPYTAWFLYGPMGAGKTRAAGSFPEPLFIVPANENSQLTLKQLADRNLPYLVVGKKGGMACDAQSHVFEMVGELERRYNAMCTSFAAAQQLEDPAARAAAEAEAAALFPWQTIVVESLTHLSEMIVASITQNGRKKMDQQGWGLLATFYSTLHSRLRNMDIHIVYTALAKSETNDEGGVIGGAPNVQGSARDKLPAMCDVVCYMEELDGGRDKGGARQSIYRAFFRKYRVWPARTRFAGFPDYIDDFTFDKIAKVIDA